MSRYECRTARIDTDITTFRILTRMSWVATKLYNTALWSARQTWAETGKIPTGFDLQKVVMASYYHKYLPAHTYQHAAHQVGNGFRSWFELRKKDATANPPGFRKKASLSTTMFTEYGFKVTKSGHILVLLGAKMRDELNYPNKRLALSVHWNTPFPKDGQIKQIEIVPNEKKGFFELHAKVLLPEPEWKTEGQLVAVDLGMRNPIVSIDETSKVDIFKGGGVLSIIHYWNKTKARVQSEIMGRSKGKKKWSDTMSRMAKKAEAQRDQAIHAMTSAFAKMCNKRDVKEVVVGDLKGIKKEEDGTGKHWNDKASQNWQQFPIKKVVAQLGYKLARFRIQLSEQDERGTSTGRCSLCGCTDRSKLFRVKRGLFKCRNCGNYQNADTNGARNQHHRYLHQLGRSFDLPSEGSSGCLAQPTVWRWDNHRWAVVG